MGFSITWFAVPEASAESFLQKLGLVQTGDTEDCPDSLISFAVMDTGWRVLWYNKYLCPFLSTEAVRDLSGEIDILVCTVEEHCMDSSSALWRDGQRRWYLHHDGSAGAKGLDVEGSPPDYFPSIRADMERQQLAAGGPTADVDYLFEIPLSVAQGLTGFKHDEESPSMVDGLFHVLKLTTAPTTPEPKRGFLGKLFGR